MKTWTEWQQEERRLMGKEDENQQKRRTVQQLQEAYEIHFRQGLQFVEKISWQFRKNDHAFLHEQMQERVFSLSRSTQEHLEVMEEVLQQEKRELEEQINEVAYEKRKAFLDEREAKA
ncbi:DUF3958 family protein [Listeria welshimeri]|uniref:DUF3958 family protein n=1 Tax=Listeria welshimeri TaxID=1643 RepID=UPI001624BFAC|nr:DUF3958 family protein [Listeria welshimeri]MBC1980750.1 DUF3958 family protein [Listeria welshimeri]MBF2531193.1 DUF3958 family protein [Listeria welshimeri]